MECQNCGAKVNISQKFCGKCGDDLKRQNENSQQDLETEKKKDFRQLFSSKEKQNNQSKEKVSVEKPVSTTKEESEKRYNYGFSYVEVFKFLNGIFSIAIASLISVILYFLMGVQDESELAYYVVLVFVIAALLYYLNNIVIKLFENIAIIAKTSVEIRNKMYGDSVQSDQTAKPNQVTPTIIEDQQT